MRKNERFIAHRRLQSTSLFTILVFTLIVMGVSSCIEIKHQLPSLIPGEYRGVFLLEKNPYKYYDDDSQARQKTVFLGISDMEIPFRFKVNYDEESKLVVTLMNGEEKIVVRDISYGTDRSTSHDTMRITFPDANAYIYAEYAEKAIQGYYRDMDNPGEKIPFNAFYGDRYLFSELPEKADFSVDGKWDMNIELTEDSVSQAIIDFQQSENDIIASIRNGEFTMDNMPGLVVKDKIWLSYFNGKEIYLINGIKSGDDLMEGYIKEGISKTYMWTATRSE